ncbi:MFS transporter [Rhodococcus sp. 06-418-5]|uniref:MFS transporter n=1 Tax=Rhodococcus sp. 06-418-5 TaxID=2022507 RepID=UPI00211B5D91|nr:MFS transporter [Rhodococcus sp. 06-418-5]
MSNTRSIDVTSVIDNAPFSRIQKKAIGLCIAIAIIDGFDAQSIGFAAPAIAADWDVPVSSFGLVFSLGLVGMMLGGMIFGPISDRYGRRNVIVGCTVAFAVFTLSTSMSTSVEMLMILRFMTGLGLGGITPNLIALASEYAPGRIRSTVVTIVVCGFSLGGFFGGFLAAYLIPTFGWHFLFVVGGILPLFLAVYSYFTLPESVRYLTVNGRTAEAANILDQVSPGSVPPGSSLTLPETASNKSSVGALFSEGRTSRTVILWSIFFMNLLVIYFVLSWMPSLFKEAGLTASVALVATALFNLGGVVGGITIGRLADRRERPFGVIATSYVLGAVFIGVVAVAFHIVPLMLIAVFVVGVGVSGSQTGISAVAASAYPTIARATGVGWAYGVGRIGSIIGPTLGGFLIAIGLGAVNIFTLTMIPTLLAAAGILLLSRKIGHSRPEIPKGTTVESSAELDNA